MAESRTEVPAPSTPLESARLMHRPLVPGDLEWLASLYADPQVMRYIATGQPRSREESAEGLRKLVEFHARNGFGLYATIEKATGRPIGRCGCLRTQTAAGTEMELAWLIDPRRQGRGYASEAAQLFAARVWSWVKDPFVVAYVRPQNAPSIRVAEKTGLRFWESRHMVGAEAWVYRLDRPAGR